MFESFRTPKLLIQRKIKLNIKFIKGMSKENRFWSISSYASLINIRCIRGEIFALRYYHSEHNNSIVQYKEKYKNVKCKNEAILLKLQIV